MTKTSRYLRVCKFEELQHYTNRPTNPWIKFYVRILYDEEMNALPIATRLLWDRLLLLAQHFANVIPNDPERLAGLTAIPTRNVREGVEQLLKGRWIAETRGPRRASKPASKPASGSASALLPLDTDTEEERQLEREVSVGSNVPGPTIVQIPDYKSILREIA